MHSLTVLDKKLVAIRLGIDVLPQENQDEVMVRLEKIIQSRLENAICSLLSDDELKKLDVESDSDVLSKHVQNFETIATAVAHETVEEFRASLLSSGGGTQ